MVLSELPVPALPAAITPERLRARSLLILKIERAFRTLVSFGRTFTVPERPTYSEPDGGRMGEIRKGTRVRLSDERLGELDDRSATLYVGRVGEVVSSSKATGLVTVEFPQDDERRPTMLTDVPPQFLVKTDP